MPICRRFPKAGWRMLLVVVIPILILTQSPHRQQDESLLHIFPQYQGATLPDGFFVYQRLNESGIAIKSITPAQDSLIVRLASPEQTIVAREVLRSSLPKARIITQQVPKPTPFWRQKLSQKNVHPRLILNAYSNLSELSLSVFPGRRWKLVYS